ncbi:MAG: FMN-binding protein [Chloroflexi bacterium]|nr:FMN-binding protein [Chloroflexota bacterium]
MPKNRLDRRLATLSAAVIGAVYAVGYVRTEHADAALGAADVATSPPATVGTAPVNTAAPVVAQSPRATATSVPAPAASRAGAGTAPPTSTSTSTAAATGAYRDGTYTGTGNSRRGSVQVSVTIQSGRIASVNIGRVSTEYPASDIARLPNEVVSRQSAQVDVVSGATFSSIAFRGAVQQALQQAQA